MTLKLRRMKAYHPRKRRKKGDLYKQTLHDLQHRLSADVGSLLLLVKEGSKEQIEKAHIQAKTDFLKTAPEMKHVANLLGERYITSVCQYLDSIDKLIHSNLFSLDPATINQCYTTTQKLERELLAA